MSYLAITLYCLNRLSHSMTGSVIRCAMPVVSGPQPWLGRYIVKGLHVRSTGKSTIRGGGLRKAAALAVGLPLLLTSMAMTPATAAPANQDKQAATTSPAAAHFEDGRYIVVLAGAAAAAYEGDVPGLAATKPQKGRKLDSGSPNYKAYDAHLRKQQRDVAAAQGVTPGKQYTAALNGFRAELTARQATALSKDNRVLVVAPDVENAPDYTTTDFLKLTGPDGVWAKQFGGEANAGKGVVVGVIDTGYAPDNPFLQGEPVQPLQGPAQVGVPYRTADGRIAMLKADGTTFEGECQKGEGTGASFDGTLCNSKVIGARYFADSFLQYVAPENRAPEELISPVDVGSHGTHTATTAAGIANVEQL